MLGRPLCSDSLSKQCLGGHYVAILCQSSAWESIREHLETTLRPRVLFVCSGEASTRPRIWRVGRFTWCPGMAQIPRKIRATTTGKVQCPRLLRHATTGKVQLPRKIRVFGGSADSFRDPGGPRTPPEGPGRPLFSDSLSKQCLGGHYVAILYQNSAWDAIM